MRKFIIVHLSAAVLAFSTVVHAQFGGIVFDPTQAYHALEQIAQAEELYTTTAQTTENVISAYNLAKRMASSPTSLYTSFGSELRLWVPMIAGNNTYGNTSEWINAINSNAGQATSAIQSASIPRVAQVTGYQDLDPKGQRAIAAQTATVDLGDSVSATNLQAIGSIRSSQAIRQAEISNLEKASHSLDPSQQTEMATLQRINQALLLLLRIQQDQSELSQGQTLQQIVLQKKQQDELKVLLQAADGYEANYNSHAAFGAGDVKAILHY